MNSKLFAEKKQMYFIFLLTALFTCDLIDSARKKPDLIFNFLVKLITFLKI